MLLFRQLNSVVWLSGVDSKMAVYENLKVGNLEVPELQINEFFASQNK